MDNGMLTLSGYVKDLQIDDLEEDLKKIFEKIIYCKNDLSNKTSHYELSSDELESLNILLGTDIEKFRTHLTEVKDLKHSAVEEFVKIINGSASKIDEILNNLQSRQSEIKEKLSGLNTQIKEVAPLAEHFQKFLNEIFNLNIQLAYLKAINDSTILSNKITVSLEANDIEKAIDNFLSLSDILHCLNLSKCSHLRRYLSETVHYWNGILKDNLSKEFSLMLKDVHWPFVSSNALTSAPSSDAMQKFQTYVEHLLLIQLPLDVEKKSSVSSTVVVNFPTISLPMALLVQPLRKRFLFHFTGNRKTNRIDKPEWYFSQILTWLHEHETFITKWVQPVFNDLGISRSAMVELMCGLVEVGVEKLQTDLEQAQYDDALFSHIVDEALGFHNELTESYNYPASLPSTTTVLTQANIFIKWINMERKYARDKVDAMLSSETAWYNVSADDHITEVGHSFLAMLSAITERFSSLPQPGHRLQFVELELELIDDLRVSLLQVLHSERADPLNSKLSHVLNTVYYLRTTLLQWDISPSMLLLNHYKNQFRVGGGLEDDSEGGIFEGSLSLLLRLQDDLVATLAEAVMLEVKAKSRPYRTDRWLDMCEDDLGEDNLTPSACPMYQILAEKLHQMNEKLAAFLFQHLCKSVATQLNKYLFEEVLLENAFSRSGGKVLERDVMKCLLPLFQQYSPSSHLYFRPLKEGCSILALPNIPLAVKKAAIVGTNMELFNSLPLELKHLTLEEVSLVIKRRSDTMTQLM